MLLAQNWNLREDQLERFMNAPEEQVRSSLAWNRSISVSMIRRLYNDESRYVLGSLATNPTVSQNILIDLRYKREVDLIHFSLNPKCPPQIRREFMQTGDIRYSNNFALAQKMERTRRRMELNPRANQ
jgi:hypothetical protein